MKLKGISVNSGFPTFEKKVIVEFHNYKIKAEPS